MRYPQMAILRFHPHPTLRSHGVKGRFVLTGSTCDVRVSSLRAFPTKPIIFTSMRFIVASRSKDTADEIRWIARDVPDLEVHLGSFESLSNFDCVATAGNSFGLMDAGMIWLYLSSLASTSRNEFRNGSLKITAASNQWAARSSSRPDASTILTSPTLPRCGCR